MARDLTESDLQLINDVVKPCNPECNSKIKSASAFFQQNPDLFKISPRPGGFLTLLVPSRSQDFMAINDERYPVKDFPTEFHKTEGHKPVSDNTSRNSKSSVVRKPDSHNKCVRRQYLKNCNEDAQREDKTRSSHSKQTFPIRRPSREILHSLAMEFPTDLCHDMALKPTEIHRKSMEMLAVTISCVMQMAAEFDVSEETLECANTYLRCMKDSRGGYPRNVVGILIEIRKRLLRKHRGLITGKERVLRIVDPRSSKSSIGSSIFSTATVPD